MNSFEKMIKENPYWDSLNKEHSIESVTAAFERVSKFVAQSADSIDTEKESKPGKGLFMKAPRPETDQVDAWEGVTPSQINRAGLFFGFEEDDLFDFLVTCSYYRLFAGKKVVDKDNYVNWEKIANKVLNSCDDKEDLVVLKQAMSIIKDATI